MKPKSYYETIVNLIVKKAKTPTNPNSMNNLIYMDGMWRGNHIRWCIINNNKDRKVELHKIVDYMRGETREIVSLSYDNLEELELKDLIIMITQPGGWEWK